MPQKKNCCDHQPDPDADQEEPSIDGKCNQQGRDHAPIAITRATGSLREILEEVGSMPNSGEQFYPGCCLANPKQQRLVASLPAAESILPTS
jgi:hypothetical protein